MVEIIGSGNKIMLRRMRREDTDNIVRWRNSDTVMKQFIIRTPLTPEIHENWIKTKIETGHVEQFIIVIKENGKEIGSTYLKDIDRENGTAEYGIFIGEEDEQGKGYGYEAQKLTLDYAFNELGIKNIVIRILSDNQASIANGEKCGFSKIEGSEYEVIIEGEPRTVIFMQLME